MSEAAIQRAIMLWLREEGGYVYKAVGSSMTQKGTPDLLVCWKGRFIGIEVKIPGKFPDKMQVRELKKIVQAGGRSIVVSDLPTLKEWLDGN